MKDSKQKDEEKIVAKHIQDYQVPMSLKLLFFVADALYR
jgi:hypothetical protein